MDGTVLSWKEGKKEEGEDKNCLLKMSYYLLLAKKSKQPFVLMQDRQLPGGIVSDYAGLQVTLIS